MTTEDFSLRELVREVTTSSTLTGPDAIAAEVMRRISEDDLVAALEQALPAFTRTFLTNARPQGAPLEADPSGPSAAPASKSARSRKVAGVRDAWKAWLNAQYRTREGWMRLGDCRADDLVFISEGLEAQARKNQARAEGFRSLADALSLHRVERVRDLPAGVLAASVGRDAA